MPSRGSGSRLLDKRALVTGSSRGIGAEIARRFALEGAHVAVNYRSSADEAESVVRSIKRNGGRALSVKADVSKPGDVAEMLESVQNGLGGLDVLVNNAGLADPPLWNAKLSSISLEQWRRPFEVDAFGTFLCTQKASQVMKRGGSVVNIASTPAISGDVDGIAYAAAKGAVLSMSRMFAKALAPKVRVNCMVFGSFETAWVEWLDRSQVESYKSAIPMGRFGKPADAASLAVFLASDESAFITGQSIILDGGEVMR